MYATALHSALQEIESIGLHFSGSKLSANSNSVIARRLAGSSTRFRMIFSAILMIVLAGCSSNPPGADYPKMVSSALAHPEQTRLGDQFASASKAHDDYSGFRIITSGTDALLVRVQMIDAAERTLDLQYFIFRGDETGRLVTEALLRAADRGVRVRLLIDDGDTVRGDEQVMALGAHSKVEIRVFNPFAYRGHLTLWRAIEFLFNSSRLDYRMHNKLLVVDNSIAIIGGRNIGNQYFQIDPASQFADDDVFVAGPVAGRLSATFDEFWNSRLAIPAAGISRMPRPTTASRTNGQSHAVDQLLPLKKGETDYASKIASGEPYAGMISGHLPLVWAAASVISDSPEKKGVETGALRGRLMSRPLIDAANSVQAELLIITPYFIPTNEELKVLQDLRVRNARVQLITNSLKSTSDIVAQAAYSNYREGLLKSGIDIYEIRALLGNTRGSGQTARISRYGNFGLHAKLFVFDRKKIFVGSMNYDHRSKRLNTEIGLIIDSAELAQQTVIRFDAMSQPANSYALALRSSGGGRGPQIVWHTEENGTGVDYFQEPARSGWQRLKRKMLSTLPIDREL